MTTKTLDPVAIVKLERIDAVRQRDEAQQQANEAQVMSQRAQQLGQEAAQKILIANGALQQCDALLKLLEPKEVPA